MVNFSLNGKVALVTGASYGIGFSIASAYAQAGAAIVFNDINQELVDKGMAAYKEIGIEAHGYVCDVTNEAQVEAFVKQVKEVWTKQLKKKVGDMKSITIYFKPEENTAYYVINDDVKGSISL